MMLRTDNAMEREDYERLQRKRMRRYRKDYGFCSLCMGDDPRIMKYAEKHQTSINGLIRKLLEETVESQSKDWLQECFDLMDRAKGNSRGKRWKREDLYDA